MFRPAILVLPLLTGACAAYERNCLNSHVSPEYGTVSAIPGGFEVSGSGVRQTPIEATQVAPNLRPGTGGDPADDYPKPRIRDLECKPLEAK